MRITDTRYFTQFSNALGFNLQAAFEQFDFADEKVEVSYRIKASAVFSSNIEGNSVDLNSFMNSQIAEQQFKPEKEIAEIEDLVKAYEFATGNELSETNLLEAHEISSRTLLISDKRGVYRTDRMGVFDSSGMVYLAIEPQFVKEKMNELFEDISVLKQQELSLEELFYHASLIHLKFAHIHPFWDGNGRAARLLEKWFLTENLNGRAWKLQSEKYYKEHLTEYYANINLGENYYGLNYDRCIPFLVMLANSIRA